VLVLSPLAEGADRFVARVGLEWGARLIVPLPMPVASCEGDFEEPGSVDEFRALLKKAELSFVLSPDSILNLSAARARLASGAVSWPVGTQSVRARS